MADFLKDSVLFMVAQKKKMIEYICYVMPVIIWLNYIIYFNQIIKGKINTASIVCAIFATFFILSAGYLMRINKSDGSKILMILCLIFTLLPQFILHFQNPTAIIRFTLLTILKDIIIGGLAIYTLIFYNPPSSKLIERKHEIFPKIWIFLMLFGSAVSVVIWSILSIEAFYSNLTFMRNTDVLLFLFLSIVNIALLYRLLHWRQYAFYGLLMTTLVIIILNLLTIGIFAFSGFIGITILYIAIHPEWNYYDKSL